MPSDHQPQTLEVEDVEQRQKRLQDILERLNGVPSTAESSNLSFDFGVRTTFAMEPPTELLSRVRQFLPEIEQSNAELFQRDPRSIDIEHIEETDERVIEMDLGLGIFEQRQTRGHSNSSSGTSSFGSRTHARDNSPSNLSASNSSSSSSSSDSDDGESEDSSSCILRSTRSQKPANPIIQVLASRNEGESSSGGHPVP